MALLEIDRLNVSYGAIHVLRDVSLSVSAGEVVTLIGANGAGKSTTLRAIMGLVEPAAGRVVYEGASLARRPTFEIVRNGMTLVPEGRAVFANLSVRENLIMGAFTRRDKGVAADYDEVFEICPRLKERLGQSAGTLSGGEQQMLSVARALMSRPRILLMDEPSLGLAPLIVEEIFRIVEELHKDGVTIFLVEQNVHMALKVAHQFYLMEQGRVTFSGEPGKLAEDEVIQRAYLGTSRASG
jgi:branched-chain amino acid transport system ATP-binding protein